MILVVVLVGFPLVRLFQTAFELGASGIRDALARPGAASAAFNTAYVGVLAALGAVVIGTAGAFVTERLAGAGRRGLRAGMLVPLLVPPFVGALSWSRAYGPGGLTDDVLGFHLPGLFGRAGVVVVLAVQIAPLVYVTVVAGLASRAEPDLERAARMSGAGPGRAFRTVTLPLLRPAVLGGAALAFVAAINAFGIPAVLGLPSGFSTLTTRIYQDLVLAARPEAFSRAVLLACGLVLITFMTVGAAELVGGRPGTLVRTSAPAGAPAPGGRSRVPATALAVYLLLTTGVPMLALLLTALTRAVGLAPVPSNWTLRNFAEVLSGSIVGAAGRSIGLAAVASTVVVLLGGLLTGLRRRGGRPLGLAALLTFAVPGSALAAAVLLAYGPWIRDTLLIILVAYLAKFWALGHRAVAGSVESVPPDLARAARVSGAGPVVALRTVVMPVLRPAIGGAWLLVFLFALHELTMSALLYGPGTDTLAVVVLNRQQLGDVTATAALAVLLTVPVLLGAVFVLGRRNLSTRMLGLE